MHLLKYPFFSGVFLKEISELMKLDIIINLCLTLIYN
jgi:hypothetical protein